MNIDDILHDKEATHGVFVETALISQTLKTVMRNGKNWSSLPNASKEALEMIATKMARILNGEANDPEHWNDIAGYARLRGAALTVVHAPTAVAMDVEAGISQIAKRLRPVVTRINDEGGAP